MRRLLISALMPLILAIPASAQTAAPTQNPQPDAAQAQDQDSPKNQSAEAILQNIQSDLEQAGLTDIEFIPSSFLVRAKDKDGNPVIMVVGPDALGAVTESPPGQGSGQSSTNGSGSTDAK